MNKLIGKDINTFAASRNDLPTYWNDSYNLWEDPNDKPRRKVTGQFIAKKYKAIIELVQETKAAVYTFETAIIISYNNGDIKIARDILTDTYLLPILNTIKVNHPEN